MLDFDSCEALPRTRRKCWKEGLRAATVVRKPYLNERLQSGGQGRNKDPRT